MAVGRREEQRMMLLSHGWVIGQLFDSNHPSEQQITQFIRTGIAGDRAGEKEPKNPEAEELVAQTLKTGVLKVER